MSRSDIPDELKEELEEALRNGRKEEAIHLLETRGGLGPKAAKAAVFLLSMAMAKLPAGGSAPGGEASASPENPPERHLPPESPMGAVKASSGCGSAVFLAVGAPLLWLLLGL